MAPRNGYSTDCRVTQGRWKGRKGILMRYHQNLGSPGGQQGQSYPVVILHACGKAKAREVRVLAVEIL